MKVYQLVAVGHLKVNGARHIVHSKVAYTLKGTANMAIPKFKEFVTTPKDNNDLNVMTDNPLRVFVEALEVV